MLLAKQLQYTTLLQPHLKLRWKLVWFLYSEGKFDDKSKWKTDIIQDLFSFIRYIIFFSDNYLDIWQRRDAPIVCLGRGKGEGALRGWLGSHRVSTREELPRNLTKLHDLNLESVSLAELFLCSQVHLSLIAQRIEHWRSTGKCKELSNY